MFENYRSALQDVIGKSMMKVLRPVDEVYPEVSLSVRKDFFEVFEYDAVPHDHERTVRFVVEHGYEHCVRKGIQAYYRKVCPEYARFIPEMN